MIIKLNAVSYVINVLDNKNYVIGLFLGIQKAYESINRHILLQNIDSNENRGICNKLIKSYF